MKIALLDDNEKDLEYLVSLCKTYDSNYKLFTYSKGRDLLNDCKTKNFDLIFLDIEMEAPNGYEIAKKMTVQGIDSILIFTTKSLDYAICGYGIAFRYLTKPISYQMFSEVMDACLQILNPQKIEIKHNTKNKIIETNSIVYFESLKHNIIFHLNTNQTLETYGTLTDYLNLLDNNVFVQIHKSYCINLQYLTSTQNNLVTLSDSIQLPIGRSKKEHFILKLQHYMRRSVSCQ